MKKILSVISLLVLLTACQAAKPSEETSFDQYNGTTENSQGDVSATDCSKLAPALAASSGCASVKTTITYSSELGYTLELPETWAGYTTAGRELNFNLDNLVSSVDFKLKDTDIFNVSTFTKDQWAKVSTEEMGPEKIGENDKYIFAYAGAQDVGDDAELMKALNEVKDIVLTFKAN